MYGVFRWSHVDLVAYYLHTGIFVLLNLITSFESQMTDSRPSALVRSDHVHQISLAIEPVTLNLATNFMTYLWMKLLFEYH